MRTHPGLQLIPVAVVLSLASLAPAATISYTANIQTSKSNPVYDILILEADSSQQVHATIYPSQLPGQGTSAITHDVPFTPVQTLVIGLTEGVDSSTGADKTQIIMFLDSGFAAAHTGIPFSSIFPGTRHSTTIANLQAAIGGDATQLAWFTDTFFPGPAAGAAFASRGPFTVAEFTSLIIDGANAVAGNWLINNLQTIPFNDVNAISGRATEVISETARIDNGPFDIAFSLTTHDTDGQFAIDKSVRNNTGTTWQRFEMDLGTGSGTNFIPSTTGDGLSFVSSLNNHEETGAFPTVQVQEDRIVFIGSLPPGGTAEFVVFVTDAINDAPTLTVRQLATGVPSEPAPALGPWSLALLVVLLSAGGFATLRRRV